MNIRSFTRAKARQIAGAYRKGASLTSLCERFGASMPVIRRTIVAQRVKIRKRGWKGAA